MGMAKTVLLALVVAAPLDVMAEDNGSAAIAHVTNSFLFTVYAPYDKVVPLFGPESEKLWAGTSWNPTFLYPRPGRDVPGAVFSVPHGAYTSVWVNTVFDLERGKMQYVSFIPDVLVSVVDVEVTKGASKTDVHVTYTRTALRGETSADVEALGARDRASGPEWQRAISGYLKTEP